MLRGVIVMLTVDTGQRKMVQQYFVEDGFSWEHSIPRLHDWIVSVDRLQS